MPNRGPSHLLPVVLAIAICALLTTAPALADDLERKGFGLRFSAALTRFSRYPDSAGIGGAGGGSPWSSSPNPASSGMNPAVGPKRYGLSAQYAHVWFDEGQAIDVYSASLSYADPSGGSWQPSVFALSSNRAPRKDGLEFQWNGIGAEVQWARKCGACTSVGINLNWFQSEIDFELGGVDVSESESTTYGVRAGVLHKCSERFFAGVALEFSGAPGETVTHDFMGGGPDTFEEDTTYSFLMRPGIYTFLNDDLTAYADYQLGHFWDGTETLTIHRLYAGLDLTVREGIYLRGGTILDHFGNIAFTVGVGVATSETFLIDVAYQYDMFPELNQDFGAAHVVSLGLTLLL